MLSFELMLENFLYQARPELIKAKLGLASNKRVTTVTVFLSLVGIDADIFEKLVIKVIKQGLEQKHEYMEART